MNNNTDTLLISSISAQQLVVKDIFCDDYLFTIPNYQRPYSWEEEHSTQLLEDLDSFAFRGAKFDDLPPYFLGSAVIIKRPSDRNAQVVDGQQRLTTLTILLSCLRYKIEDKKNKETISSLIFQSGDELLGTAATFRLKSRERDQDFFNSYVQEEYGINEYFSRADRVIYENDAQRKMLKNVKALINKFEEKQYSQDQLKHLTKYIIQKCVIVIVASTDEEMAFRIFNVLNDRGKDLTISDILKSEVLEKVGKKEEKLYTERWEDCETELGIENFKDFFSHLRAMFVRKKAEESVLVEIRKKLMPADSPEKFINEILIPFSNAFSNVLKQDFESAQFAEQINYLFSKLKRVAHTDWMPSAIFFMARHPNAPQKIRDFLVQLEKVTLGMEAMKSSLNERLERYADINARIENGTDLLAADSEFLLNDEDREYIIATLTGPDIYGKRLVKPILAKIEEQMNDGAISIHFDKLSIEHILPQTPSDIYWTERFSAEDMSKLKNSLGNLSLITVRKNSQASNYEYLKKIDVYFKADGRASNLAMVNNLANYPEWKPEHIKSRNVALLNLFLKAVDLKIIG